MTINSKSATDSHSTRNSTGIGNELCGYYKSLNDISATQAQAWVAELFHTFAAMKIVLQVPFILSATLTTFAQEYPDLSHGCWDEAFSTSGLFHWLFGKKKQYSS